MDRFTNGELPTGGACHTPTTAPLIPFRWWASPGYAIEPARRDRAYARPLGATIRAHALAGMPPAPRPIAPKGGA